MVLVCGHNTRPIQSRPRAKINSATAVCNRHHSGIFSSMKRTVNIIMFENMNLLQQSVNKLRKTILTSSLR